MHTIARHSLVPLITALIIAAVVLAVLEFGTASVGPPDRAQPESFWESLRGTKG